MSSVLAWQPLLPARWVVAVAAVMVVWQLLPLLRTRSAVSRRTTRAGMVALTALVLLGPGAGAETTTYEHRPEVQVLVVLDRTVSMSATDGPGGSSRLETARQDLVALARRLPDADLALLLWGSRSRLSVPFTSDRRAWEQAVDAVVRDDPLAGRGSRVDRPLEAMRDVLAAARTQHPDRHTTVLFASDGENTAPGEPRPFDALAPLMDGGAVLGYGTTRGGTMPLREDLPDGAVVPDPQGGPAVSQRDDASLGSVAGQLGLPLVLRDRADALATVTDVLQPPPRVETGSPVVAHELTWVVAALLLLLVLVELRLAWRGWHQARRMRGRS